MLRRLRDKRDELKAIRDAEVERIDSWYKGQVGMLDKNLSWFEAPLKAFLMAMRETDPKYVLRTPYGTVSLKKPGEEWKYPEDEAAFIAYLEHQGLPFVRVKKELDRKAIREQCRSVTVTDEDSVELRTVCTADGMMLEGIVVEPTPETLMCRFPKGDGAGD
jgi:malate synthase